MRALSRLRLADIATYVVMLGIAAFSVFPIVWMAMVSFKTEAEIISSKVGLIPHSFSFDNYVAAWTRSNFPSLIANSVVTTGMTVALCVLFGAPAAYAISRYKFEGRVSLMMFFLITRMLPTVAILIPLFIVLKNLGLLDSKIGLAIAYTSFLLPIFIWMMKGFFDALPAELEEAARSDGMSRMRAMATIMLPLAAPGLAATCVFVAIGAWNEYLFALLMTTSANSRTWPVGLQLMIGEFQLDWGTLAAGGILSILPVVVLFALVQRLLVKGLTAGAVKG